VNVQIRDAWIRIMSAIQTSESMEFHILNPLLGVCAQREDFVSFFTQQADDEKRHSELIRNFLNKNFGYVKTKATFSDKIFYSLLFPAFKLIIKKNALYGLCAILFYEYFSVGLYRELRDRAKEHELPELEKLLTEILIDEGKHIKNISAFIRTITHEQVTSKSQNINILRLLYLISLDVSFNKWAFHNREIRQSLIILNIQPEIINLRRINALANIKSLLYKNIG
jgi:ferritin